MILNFIASDTQKRYIVNWHDASVLPFCSMDIRAIFNADYIPNLKCRWGTPSLVKYDNTTGELTITEHIEGVLRQLMKEYKNHGYDIITV